MSPQAEERLTLTTTLLTALNYKLLLCVVLIIWTEEDIWE